MSLQAVDTLAVRVEELKNGLIMSRGYQKLVAFLIGFPLFVFAFGACGNAGFQSDMEDFRFYGLLTLAGLILWLWGMFAPMK